MTPEDGGNLTTWKEREVKEEEEADRRRKKMAAQRRNFTESVSENFI